MKEKILVVENEIIIACDIKTCLEKAGYTVPAIAAYGEQAIAKAAELRPDLVLMDVMLKGKMSGIEAAAEIGARFNIPVVYLTAYSDQSNLQKAKTTQPFGYILKPFEETQLITTIEIALNKYQTEVLMREALEKEKEHQKVKSQFFSMMSHEFRNPLSNIFTCAELLTNHSQQLNEAKKDEYLTHIQNSVQHLENLLGDVLLIGKAEIDKTQFKPEPLDLENFCKNLITDTQLTASENHKIIFTVQGSSSTTESSIIAQNSQLISLDEKMLRHILTNLLTNAVKYSPQGGTINFEIFYVPGEVIFRIKDEGIGIPEADQENLFNSFHRCSNVGTIPGNGLGLAIVKHYVELHGGEISFASKPGIGTTFIVNLPI
ncbi:ATP-binding protein [Nostoc sp. 106C]|jgi:signal transduction histidine kinase|uniref:hybrid sensor histidine kinase/response regulator n=1 Tax=Nostoc sp. 106C TaxID=1932667 RepID=UPI000A370058|nr:ATP-binding protein [Nostoc sp. 106C]OUL30175.1 hybrid sensor histidine kinase/response regulator [Nostoc sp. RF31YmG]OUL34587.1 hybrid sensor histidine kinase/response regulator [Nostoc sp. 106C]